MNNDTSNRSTPATASPLTVKEAAPPVMIKKIGKTTYRVKIHFSETSKETMSDKIKRLILNDSESRKGCNASFCHIQLCTDRLFVRVFDFCNFFRRSSYNP